MPNYIKDQAIILKRVNYKDADRILTLFTRDHGKISANAKGIRKLLSKKRSHLELLNLTNVYIIKTGERNLITQAELINPYSNLKSDFDRTSWGYYAAEIFNKLLPEDEPNPILFDLLNKTLQFIDKHENPNILNAYNLKLIKILGFYSRREPIISSSNLTDYFNNLEQLNFESILKLDVDAKNVIEGQRLLIELTENIIESKIKTQPTYRH